MPCPRCKDPKLEVLCAPCEVILLKAQIVTLEKEVIEEDKREAAEVGKLREDRDKYKLLAENRGGEINYLNSKREKHKEAKILRGEIDYLTSKLEVAQKDLYEQEKGQVLQIQSMAAQIRRISDQRESNLERAEKAEDKVKELEGEALTLTFRARTAETKFGNEVTLRERDRKEAAMLRDCVIRLANVSQDEAKGKYCQSKLDWEWLRNEADKALSRSSSEWFDKKMKEAEARGIRIAKDMIYQRHKAIGPKEIAEHLEEEARSRAGRE